MNPINGSIQVVNTLTGEITQFDYKNVDELKNAYLEIESMFKTIERAMKKMKGELEVALGEQPYIDFADGYRLKKFQTTRYEYDKAVVAKYIKDADMLDLVTKIDGTALKTLWKELVEQDAVEPGAWNEIERFAKASYSEYVRLIKSVK